MALLETWVLSYERFRDTFVKKYTLTVYIGIAKTNKRGGIKTAYFYVYVIQGV